MAMGATRLCMRLCVVREPPSSHRSLVASSTPRPPTDMRSSWECLLRMCLARLPDWLAW